jgi:type IV secretion system protein VirB10
MNSGKPAPHEDAGGGPSLTFSRPPEPRPAAATHPLPLPITAAPHLNSLAPEASALDSPMVAYRSSNWAAGNALGSGSARLGGKGQDSDGADDELSQRLRGSNLGGRAVAHVIKHPELTIPAGTIIPCILQTAINSQLVGFVDCTLPEEVRGATGQVTLLDRGSSIFGEIRSGLQNGQSRLFILWVRARTPQNVVVELDSPAADDLGRAGVDGAVNTHFWSKFGAALLYSVVDYAPQLAASALQRNGGYRNTNQYLTFISPQQQLANTILQKELSVPDELTKNQGDTVTIFVARDVDFSGVYDLQNQPPPP